jgi:hypothetical protein
MKTTLIVILTVALAAAAFVTRPGKREFMLHLLDRHPGGSWTTADLARADDLASRLVFTDRYLWTDVEQDGVVIYSGAFSHFVPRGQKPEIPVAKAAELTRLLASR